MADKKDSQQLGTVKKTVMTTIPEINRVGLYRNDMILVEFGFEVNDGEFEISNSLALDKKATEVLIKSLAKAIEEIDNNGG